MEPQREAVSASAKAPAKSSTCELRNEHDVALYQAVRLAVAELEGQPLTVRLMGTERRGLGPSAGRETLR